MSKILAQWTIEDYHRMIEAGILRDRHVELLAGEIVEMSPETPLHYTTAKGSAKYLGDLLVDRADIRFNGPITLPDSEPEPDIAIVRLPDTAYRDRHPVPQDIYWIVEVAKTSLKTDLKIKSAIYARAGISEHWILDISTRQVIVLRNPQGDRYQSLQTYGEDTIQPLAFADLDIEIQKLFP